MSRGADGPGVRRRDETICLGASRARTLRSQAEADASGGRLSVHHDLAKDGGVPHREHGRVVDAAFFQKLVETA